MSARARSRARTMLCLEYAPRKPRYLGEQPRGRIRNAPRRRSPSATSCFPEWKEGEEAVIWFSQRERERAAFSRHLPPAFPLHPPFFLKPVASDHDLLFRTTRPASDSLRIPELFYCSIGRIIARSKYTFSLSLSHSLALTLSFHRLNYRSPAESLSRRSDRSNPFSFRLSPLVNLRAAGDLEEAFCRVSGRRIHGPRSSARSFESTGSR